jgi:hypothetical protein
MLLVKATPQSEAGVLPDPSQFEAMGTFNESMVKAGVMLAGDGLQPSSKGARVRFTGGKPSVTDGPFTETTELVAGYWIISAKSKEEAIAWVSRAPFDDAVVEVRRIYEADDFPADAFPPELRERAQALHEEIQRKA